LDRLDAEAEDLAARRTALPPPRRSGPVVALDEPAVALRRALALAVWASTGIVPPEGGWPVVSTLAPEYGTQPLATRYRQLVALADALQRLDAVLESLALLPEPAWREACGAMIAAAWIEGWETVLDLPRGPQAAAALTLARTRWELAVAGTVPPADAIPAWIANQVVAEHLAHGVYEVAQDLVLKVRQLCDAPATDQRGTIATILDSLDRDLQALPGTEPFEPSASFAEHIRAAIAHHLTHDAPRAYQRWERAASLLDLHTPQRKSDMR
jgi:hypothetical protein